MEDEREVRSGRLRCHGEMRHLFEIKDGMVEFCTGFDHELVKRELAYENSTYHGSPRLRDPALIAQFPETLAELWPHIANFGPDFTDLIDRIDVRQGAWVLDVGTGPCWSSRLLAQRGARVIALDVNEANFYGLGTADILFDAHGIYFERVLESMTELPFADCSIDRITFNASFHHTPDLGRTLRECCRVLKRDGLAAMVNEEFASLRQRWASDESISDTGSHHRIDYQDFEAEAREAGFGLEFFVADHVRRKLSAKLPGPSGQWVVKFFEKTPFALKQLNSALIVLKKERTPPVEPRAAREKVMVAHYE
jgi:SAM-dependent methyltransferase